MENSIKAIREMVLATNGKTFGVKFVKADGTDRTMTCRLGVKKGVKGTTPIATAKRKATLKDNGKMGVYEMYDFQSEETRGFRTINLNTLKEFKFGGKVISFS
jgi:hypothetical protein